MKKLLSMALLVFLGHAVLAQKNDTTGNKKPTFASLNLANRANDHFMIELSYDNWIGKTDSMRTTGFSRGFAFYFMYDFPFKTDPHFSVGAGLGINASNIFFDRTNVGVATPGNATLAFTDVSQSDHFKKYKLVLTNLDLPLELRYAFNPANTNRSWKIALGVKAGLLLSTYTKGKDKENAAGQVTNSYIEKQSSTRFFNSGRLVATGRVSYGWIGVFGTYQITSLIASGAGPSVNPYSLGIVLSGL
jgi:hypothetical protein